MDIETEQIGSVVIQGTPVFGVGVDPMTRCRHYHGDSDIIAIRFKCCGQFFPCHLCHELAGHPVDKWSPSEFDVKAILCGACGTHLSINQYMRSEFLCPECGAGFNPGCKGHYGLYFEIDG